MATYAIIYFGAALLAMCLVPIVSQMGKRFCLLEVHGLSTEERQNLIPRIGGIVILVATLTVVLMSMLRENAIGQSFIELHTQIVVLLIIGSLVFVVGLTDDLFSLSGHTKLICLIMASVCVCISGTTLQAISVGQWFVIKTGLMAWPLTIVWIVTITVCMSFIDGLDGLAGGIAVIVCGTILLMAVLNDQTVMAVLMLALLGSVTGFLFFNWHPAKIFLGNSGSMFLGFMIGAGSLVCQTKTYTLIGLMLPILALGVPIIDTTLSILRRRLLERRSIFGSDPNHLYNRLVALGFTPRSVVLIFCAVTAVSASVGVFLLTARSGWSVGISVSGLFLLYSLFFYLGRGYPSDIPKLLKHNWTIACEARALKHNFENAEVRMLNARSLSAWWQVVCALGREMRFQNITLWDCHNGRDSRTCVWTSPEGNYTPERTVQLRLPLGGNGAGGWEIMASLWVDNGLELGGQQAMFLARLLDEFPIPESRYAREDDTALVSPPRESHSDTMPSIGVERYDTQIAQTETPHSKGRFWIPRSLDIVGLPVTPFKTYDQALTCIENAIASDCKCFCAAVNPIKIYNAWRDPELKHLLQQVDILICDGVGVVRASQILYGQKIQRITGCDLFFELLLMAARRQWGIFLLGASAQSNSAAGMALQAMYPALKIAGSQDGFFEDSEQVVEDINASGAKMLFVAMGSPKQEQWICRHRESIKANFCMGVGGSFDVAAGRVKRAPKFFRMTGTEFLFRFVLEPRKRLSQQKALLNFVSRVIFTRLSAPRQSMSIEEEQHEHGSVK